MYREMVLDTVTRCKNYLKSNPGIQNPGGFVLKAIQNDFYQQEREEEARKAEKIAQQKYQKDLEKEVAALLKEGKKKFEENRAPKLQELKAKHLNDELIEAAIKEYAPGELVSRKVLATVQAGKPSKLADRRVDDYLAERYLDGDQKNLDTFLAKNYSLEKTDSGYQLSI